MTTNPFFNTMHYIPEQDLFASLSEEFVKIFGFNTYYLPRTAGDPNVLWNEDSGSSYNRAFLIEMYMKNSYGGFSGLGDFLSANTGATIDDKITLVLAHRPFNTEIGQITNQSRPYEGDIVFLEDIDKKPFRITFVEHESIFYQGGSLFVWELECELFTYSGEIFNTGITDIDNIVDGYDIMSVLGTGLILEQFENNASLLVEQDGLPLFTEDVEDETNPNNLMEINDYVQEKGIDDVIYFDDDENNPFVNNPGGIY